MLMMTSTMKCYAKKTILLFETKIDKTKSPIECKNAFLLIFQKTDLKKLFFLRKKKLY